MSHADDSHATRRDFIYYATAGAGAVVTVAAVRPLVNQMNPTADVVAQASMRVAIDAVDPGTQIKVLWQGKPIFIRRRTEEEIEGARSVDVADLPDPFSRNENIPDGWASAPATDDNRSLDETGEWLVMTGICTHLGCVPLGKEEGNAGEFDGWFCPCHGSHYDSAGRIRKGPAPENLHIPLARFVGEAELLLGTEES